MVQTVQVDLGGRIITLETGKMAKQANGAVVVRSGDSVVLVTACMAEEPKPGAGFFPLTVDYREYTYAAGKIPGGFIKREGRPTEKEILTSRMIDRPIRPLFPEGYSCETQIIGMVLSADPERGSRPRWPWSAPAPRWPFPTSRSSTCWAAVRVGMVDGQLIANPSYAEAARIQAQHRRGRHRRRHRDGGSRRARRSPKTRCWAPSNSATSAARRSPPAFANWWPRPASRSACSRRPPSTRSCTTRSPSEFRADLSDALNTAEVPQARKLLTRVAELQGARPWSRVPKSSRREAAKLLRAL